MREAHKKLMSVREAVELAIEASDDASLKETPRATLHDEFMTVVNANYGRYIKRAYSYLKSESLAEDAVQEGILSAYKNLHTIRDVKAMKSWINRIIINKSLDILRKAKRMPDFYADIDDIVSYSGPGLLNEPLWAEMSTPEQDIMKKEHLQKLTQSIEGLKDIYRIPLLLKDNDGFTIKEISKLLDISESNAKVRVHRARIKVKLELGDYFFPYQN